MEWVVLVMLDPPVVRQELVEQLLRLRQFIREDYLKYFCQDFE